jgi:hypothetical protein
MPIDPGISRHVPITHWMPLPLPPLPEEGK